MCASHMLCCQICIVKLCPNADPKCASHSTMLGTTDFVCDCKRKVHVAFTVCTLCTLKYQKDRRCEILCTSDKHPRPLVPCKLQTRLYLDHILWSAIGMVFACHVICLGVQNVCLYVSCNMLWCAK